MSKPRGKSLELFYVDGKPDGMVTAEIFNWTGHVLMTPRTQLPEALRRPAAAHTGAYVLIGEDETGLRAYIGESEDVARRLRNHAAEKDWWTHAYILTSASNALNKAHVKYLESRLIGIAKDVGAATIENGNTPTRGTLHEAGEVTMEEFLDNLMIALPALGLDMFLQKTRTSKLPESAALPTQVIRFELSAPKQGLLAFAYLEDGDFVVEAGSTARTNWIGGGGSNVGYMDLQKDLVELGFISGDHEIGRFSINYAFTSPSAAAAIINGRNSNGPKDWRVVGTGQTYKEWEAARLAAGDIDD